MLIETPSFFKENNMCNEVKTFIEKRQACNQQFMANFGDQLEKLKSGQAPECYVVMCGDSRCAEEVFSGNSVELGDVFGGPATMGNIVSETIMATLAYNVDHLKTKYFVVCGHTGCGAINASMGDFSGERPVLKKALANLKASYEVLENHPEVETEDPALQNVFRNVQAQVLKVMDEFKPEIESESFVVLGAVYDNQGQLGPVGKVYFTSINGEYCYIV